MHPRVLACLILTLGITACDTQTQSEDAHVHGHARLAIAVEGPTEAEIEFESPAQSLYGFEHEPSTAEEEAVQAEALASLDTEIAELLVVPEPLGCRFETLAVEVVEDEHEGEAHEDDEYEGEEHEAGTSGEHREVHARYRLSCESPLDGSRLSADFGSRFEGIEELIVTILGDDGQRGLELEDGRGEIDL